MVLVYFNCATVQQLVALLPCNKNILGSTPGQGSFFACSPRPCVGSLRLLRLSPTVQNMTVKLSGLSTLPQGVNECVRGCLSCVCQCCPVMDWRPVQGLTHLTPIDCLR
ncbi:hypothetical protein ILYODFUR_037165 [Ilyodon furcidens]|uniref:Uncharacterized protein n=1 Tax=Ilyodon furcidens TaxID=33524 RepID=A0ABV0SSA5_9TELE